MSNRLSCEDVEALLFELHRDELSDLKQEAVDDHIRSCHRCLELTTKITDLFETASQAEASTWADINPDALFESIEATLVEDSEPEDQEANERLDELFDTARGADEDIWMGFDSDALFDRITERMSSPDTDDINDLDQLESSPANEQTSGDVVPLAANREEKPPRRAARRWALAVAAAAGIAFVAWLGLSIVEPAGDRAIQNPADALASQTEDPDETPAELQEAPPFSLPPMESAPSTHESIRIFASEGADYSLGEEQDSVLELTDGSVLIEYFPEQDTTFAVRAGAQTITVEGTVFSVTLVKDSIQVAVFEGAVRVTAPEKTSRKIKAGEFFTGDDTSPLDDAITREVERYIDLKTHRKLLRQALVESEPDEEPSGDLQPVAATTETSVPEHRNVQRPKRDSPRVLREQALEALHDGEPRQAITLLSEALEKTAPTDQASADILLELARIHLHSLGEPDQAADYLDRFITRWPDDPAADAIRFQLCGMTAGKDNPICD